MEPVNALDVQSSEALLQENLQLKSELKRQKQLYEQSHVELIKQMVESEVAARKIGQSNKLIRRTLVATINVLQRVIDLREPGYLEHSTRVGDLCRAIALGLQESPAVVSQIHFAALVHEIGKMSLPDRILKKPRSELKEGEITLLRNQYVIGAQTLAQVAHFQEISRVIKHVRENVDGTGLPEGLAGKDIPLGSRIIALADFFDTSFFISQEYSTIEQTLTAIRGHCGRLFDEQLFGLLQNEVHQRFSAADRPRDVKVLMAELIPGMRISRDLLTVTGVLLTPRDTELTQRLIDKISSYQTIDPIKSGVYIYK